MPLIPADLPEAHFAPAAPFAAMRIRGPSRQ